MSHQFFGMKIRHTCTITHRADNARKRSNKAFRNAGENENAWRRGALSEDQISTRAWSATA